MSQTKLFSIAHCPFEAARQVSILPPEHPSSRIHGHSFIAKVRQKAPLGHSTGPDQHSAELKSVIAALDYQLLNHHLSVPTDENLARYVREHIKSEVVVSVGIQSTRNQGVDLDANDVAHIWRRFRFEAAHRLPNVPDGHPCGRMHGHGFEVVLHARESVAQKDMGIDFDRLEELWQPIKAVLDRTCLNQVPGLENPTSELIAKWVWDRLKPELDELSWVTVYETATAGCHYDGEAHRIWKQFRFESALSAAPHLIERQFESLFGHSYIARLHLKCDLDAVLGWTVDYGDVKSEFKPFYDQLDHHLLSEIDSLPGSDIGSIALWMKEQVSESLPSLDGIDLFETPESGAFLCWGDLETPPLPV